MAKRISETERLIGFGLNASEDILNGAIQSLTAIRNNRFPVEKKTRKPRKPREVKSEKPKAATANQPENDAPKPIARKCTSCDWKGKMSFPEPCPECGQPTEAK